MSKIISVFLFLIVLHVSGQSTFHKKLKLMGSRFDIYVVAKDSLESQYFIKMATDEISRIETMISSWDSRSFTSEINRNAGVKPVKVPQELFDLVQRALTISRLTDGAFDISYASMDRIWKFDGSMNVFPKEEIIKKSVEKVGYKNIVLNKEKQTIFLSKTGMKIGFGAIGKGYAADKAKALLVSKGIKAGIINASGDMNTWGKQPDGKDWQVAITNPMDKNKVFALLPIKNGAVVTSGNYEKFVEFNGIRYTHIIDPRTGYPSHGIVSASVFAPSAELADALATSVFVMGKDVGIDRIDQLSNIECIIVDDKGRIFTSKGIQLETTK